MMNFSGHYNNWACGPGAFFQGPLGLIITLLFWGLVLYLVVKLFQAVFRTRQSPSSTSLEILKKRYAKGEISEEEYKKMKAELE